uniref:Putative odorant binding protein n=1 Tax=Anopheles marajoara TaxID=58244 RepID=A0A2M4BMU8_9DIPT
MSRQGSGLVTVVAGLVLFLVPLVVAGDLQQTDVSHLYVAKSFNRALLDCLEYLQLPGERFEQYSALHFPDDADTKCLVRCIGLNMRWWNDTTGVQKAVMGNFFQPDPSDTEYEYRTAKCIEKRLGSLSGSRGSAPDDCCCRAYETFQCYLQYYGNLVQCPKALPQTRDMLVRSAHDCINILRVPDELLRCYSAGELRDAPETRCFLRCFFLRSGGYDAVRGFNLYRLYSRDSEHLDQRYLAQETMEQLQTIRSTNCDQCTEVYRSYKEVLGPLGIAFYEDSIIQEAANRALSDGSRCKECGQYEIYSKAEQHLLSLPEMLQKEEPVKKTGEEVESEDSSHFPVIPDSCGCGHQDVATPEEPEVPYYPQVEEDYQPPCTTTTTHKPTTTTTTTTPAPTTTTTEKPTVEYEGTTRPYLSWSHRQPTTELQSYRKSNYPKLSGSFCCTKCRKVSRVGHRKYYF